MKSPLSFNPKQKKSQELGFGNKAYGKNTRMITSDGISNVKREGLNFWSSLDAYHELINMHWLGFILILFLSFVVVNLIFAVLYYLAGKGAITGANHTDTLHHFLDAFYFSTQTITTVGFGGLSPNSNWVSILSAFESFLGLLGIALATGLMFARFSKPRKRLMYSENAIIAPYHHINALMFRFANGGKNQLIENEVEVVATVWDEEEDRRIFQPLKLERSKINFLSTTWTIVHPIDEKSPLNNLTKADMKQHSLEIIIMFKAFDNTYARMIYDRRSYSHERIVWGKKFVPVFIRDNETIMKIDMKKLGQMEDATLN